MNTRAFEAFYASLAADAAWHAELVRVYGGVACEARYDARGYATPALATLKAEYLRTSEARHEASNA